MPRMSKKKFGDDANSVRSKLMELDDDTQRRFTENQRRYQGDIILMESWARTGFISGSEVLMGYRSDET